LANLSERYVAPYGNHVIARSNDITFAIGYTKLSRFPIASTDFTL
jgi:hypothetical protein